MPPGEIAEKHRVREAQQHERGDVSGQAHPGEVDGDGADRVARLPDCRGQHQHGAQARARWRRPRRRSHPGVDLTARTGNTRRRRARRPARRVGRRVELGPKRLLARVARATSPSTASTASWRARRARATASGPSSTRRPTSSPRPSRRPSSCTPCTRGQGAPGRERRRGRRDRALPAAALVLAATIRQARNTVRPVAVDFAWVGLPRNVVPFVLLGFATRCP